MKGLAIDSAISKITISARNDDHTISAVFDIGMKQSETLLPAIDYVLEKAELKSSELEYLALCAGPGSFTGLRLGFSALKAIELSSGCPLYGINTLDVYAAPYKSLPFTVISCIDAKKDRFYAKAFMNDKTLLEDGDYTPEEIAAGIKNGTETIVICGSDAIFLSEQLAPLVSNKIIPMDFSINAGEVLLNLVETNKDKGLEPLNEYDGPIYLRASEAEIKLNN